MKGDHSSIRLRLFLFGAVALGALALGVGVPGQWLAPLLRHSGYYFVLAGFAVWVLLAARNMQGRWRGFWKRNVPALVLAAGLMSLICLLSPPQFKVLGDEANLVGTSMSMHFEKTTVVPLQGLGLEYYPFDYAGRIDQRPLLFPFVVSLVHAARGYSAFNGMLANAVIGGLLLFVFYLWAAGIFSSRSYGLAGMLLLAACPGFVTWVTASGFEVLNLFYVVAAFYILYRLAQEYSAEESTEKAGGPVSDRGINTAELFLLTLVLLAQCRYESALFFVGLAAVLPLLLRRRMIVSYGWPTLLVPLLLLPVVWQRRFTFFHAAVQTGSATHTPEQVFSFGNLAANLPKNLFVLSGLEPGLGFLPLVFVAAVIGLVLAAGRLAAGGSARRLENRVTAAFALLTVVPLFLVYAAFFWGDMSSPMDNRLSLVFLPFLIVPALYWPYRMFAANGRRQGSWLVIGLALILLVYYRPVAERQEMIQGKSLTYEYNRVLDFLYAHYEPQQEKILIISDRTNFFTIHEMGSIGFRQAGQQAEQLRYLDSIYYDTVLVLQRADPETGQILSETRLPGPFTLQSLHRIDVGPDYYVLISKAVIGLPGE